MTVASGSRPGLRRDLRRDLRRGLRPGLRRGLGPIVWVLAPVGLVVLAAVLRLPDLATRGTWDADQGHDMLMLRALVHDGVVPLLGPPTSIGDVHHGALYYYLLSPAALLTGGDSPLAVAALIAFAGIAAVVVTWWLARSIGGPVAGFVAGFAMAVSGSAVEESTFIWNPNLIALSSAIALACAWHAWSTRQARWWLLVAVGTAVTMQCHVLGVTMLPIVGALLVADARARPAGAERRRVWRFGLAGLAIIALSFLPLVIHELTTDFSEIHAALDYIRSGGDQVTLGPLVRFLVVGVRVVSWPLTGLITDAAGVALIATVIVIVIAVGLAQFGALGRRQAPRWLGLGLLWTVFALTFISPSLASVVPGLPNDHYHAFADPMVFSLVGLGAGALWRVGSRARTGAAPANDARTEGGAGAGIGLGSAAESGAGSGSGAGIGLGSAAGSGAGAGIGLGSAAGSGAGAGIGSAHGAGRRVSVGPVVVVVVVAALVGWNFLIQPPAVHPDGGFPAAELATARIVKAAGAGEIALRSLPAFKSAEAYAYPLVRAGVQVRTDAGTGPVAATAGTLVVICDSLFEVAIGKPCGGPAEAVVAPPDRFGEPVDRFSAAPGRTISIYRPAP